MAIQQPQATDLLNAPDHALSHRVFANDGSAPNESVVVASTGNVGVGTINPGAKLSINGGLHVGGDSDPGDNNLLVDGTITATGEINGSNLSNTNTGDQTLVSLGAEAVSNKATTFGTINDTLYPSVKAVNDAITVAVTGKVVGTEIPAGTVDGSNVTFTATTIPKVVVVDQGRTMMLNHGWSLAGLVMTLDIAPTFEIFNIY